MVEAELALFEVEEERFGAYAGVLRAVEALGELPRGG
jgi:hypothetical protein